MKIDLDNNQYASITPEHRAIKLELGNNNKAHLVIMGLTDAIAYHAALGEEIKALRKRKS